MTASFTDRIMARRKRRIAQKTERSLSDEVISDPKQLKVHASLAILTKDIGEILDKQFPGWAWVVSPDQDGQIINIFNLHLHDEWGFTIRTVEIHNDPKRRLAYRAGREILERFGITPGPLSRRTQELANLRRDHKGRAIVADAWDVMTRQQREQKRLMERADNIEKGLSRIDPHQADEVGLEAEIKRIITNGD